MEQVQEVNRIESMALPQILIMEDEVTVAKGLEMVLTEEGYTVDLAMTGQSALHSMDHKTFDLLIADLRLPDIDGMEVIKRVKTDRPDTGVIVITGYSTVPSAIEALKLGAHDYLPKPFTEDEIMAAVKDALDVRSEVLLKKKTPAPPVPRKVIPPLEPLPEDLRQVNEIVTEIRHDFSGKRDEIIPMLQKVQNRLGYIPEIAMEAIARLTKSPAAAVYGVATFYEQFRFQPVGKHIVKVCRGTACHVKGAERILNEIEAGFRMKPGETSRDRQFTLETVACFGSCAIAPVVLVDGAVKGRMNPAKTSKVMNDVRENNDR